jgi:hypothetical protein
MAFLRNPAAPPLPADVRLVDGRLQRYDVAAGWTDDGLRDCGPWCDWRTDYRSGDVVTDLHDLGGLWVCVDAAADRWALIAPSRGEATP